MLDRGGGSRGDTRAGGSHTWHSSLGSGWGWHVAGVRVGGGQGGTGFLPGLPPVLLLLLLCHIASVRWEGVSQLRGAAQEVEVLLPGVGEAHLCDAGGEVLHHLESKGLVKEENR